MNNFTKADMLAFLSDKITHSYVLPQLTVEFSQWLTNKHSFLKKLLTLKANSLAVRSSAQDEDVKGHTKAGQYLTKLNVENSPSSVEKSVNEVFNSFTYHHDKHQVIVQPMLNDVTISGVIFTYEPSTSSAYYVLNYDDESCKTDTVTSGETNHTKTEVISHFCQLTQCWQEKVINAVKEIQLITGEPALDIEFAIDDQNQVCIFQVRALGLVNQDNINLETHTLALNCIHNKVFRLSQRHPYLLGEKSIFGVMPDWNPAEIIGTKPRSLALSLYKELITNNVWSHQRSAYGYRNVKDFPLMVVLGGTPFVDVRLSVNSLIPKSLDEKTAEKLVTFYINKLEKSPSLHDKIEFSIVHSCFSFDMDTKLAELRKNGFEEKEVEAIRSSLLALTKNIIEDEKSVWRQDINHIETLVDKQTKLQFSHLNSVEKIYWFLKDCRNFGTLPFAGLARVGFIAVQILESLVSSSLLSEARYHEFLASVNTVSSNLTKDFNRLTREEFLLKYGHLRPGTYDILSKRYDENADVYFDWNNTYETEGTFEKFELMTHESDLINRQLALNGFSVNAQYLLRFIQEAIEAREFGKFVFTKSLSDCFLWIEKLGKKLGFSREEMSYVDIQEILKLYSSSFSAELAIKHAIEIGKKEHQLASRILLPSLITTKEQTYHYALMFEQANFITTKRISGKVVKLDNNKTQDLSGAIVFIEAADPGYDWIFSKGIGGFITKYGGCNSHMAIRANEQNIAAIVGAGEVLFNRWINAQNITIDCANKKVDVL